MTAILAVPEEAAATIDEALHEMEVRAAARKRVDQHLEACQECDDVLCYVGAQLVRAALT